jgi:hypothetical protein
MTDLFRRACPYGWDGTQTHHWRLAGLTPAELDEIEAHLAERAPETLCDAACVHTPERYRAYHRLRSFRRARYGRAALPGPGRSKSWTKKLSEPLQSPGTPSPGSCWPI